MESEKCSKHIPQDAVANCTVCEKPVCKDCHEMYNAESGEYKGKSFCYDCICGLISENTANMAKFRKTVTTERVMALVMAVVLMFVGSALLRDERGDGVPILIIILAAVLLGGCIGMLPAALKAFKNGDTGLALGCIFGAYIIMIRARNRQLKQCVEVATADSFTVSKIRNHLMYTQFMEKNEGTDLARLTAKSGKLSDNQYAVDVCEKGEEPVRAELRQGVLRILENNGLIKEFNDGKMKEKAV